MKTRRKKIGTPGSRAIQVAVAALLTAASLAACGSDAAENDRTETEAEPGEASAAPVADLPVPDGCPEVGDFGSAWFLDAPGLIEEDHFEAATPSRFNPYLSSDLPPGGCGFAETEVRVGEEGNEYRMVKIVYFNLGEGDRPTGQDLREWMMGLSETSDSEELPGAESTTFRLPASFSGFTSATLTFDDGDVRLYGTETIPEFTGRESGTVSFALDAEDVDEIVASSVNEGPSTDAEPADVRTAMASGAPAPFEVAFDTTDDDGYTTSVSLRGQLDPFTSDVSESLPGEFEAVSQSTVRATVTSTTAGRSTPVPDFQVISVYARDNDHCSHYSLVSKAGDDWTDPSFCYVVVGGTPATELAPDAGETELEPVVTPIGLEGLSEASDALEDANKPLAFYVRFGSAGPIATTTNASSTVGCMASQSSNGALWYVPMDNGWPDPICG